ncbi:MAG TPA: PAS domain-containing protein [Stenomitos sp.]
MPSLNHFAARVAGKVSLRTVLIVPFVMQIVGTVGLVGYLSFNSGQKAVEDLAQKLMVQVGERVSDRLTSYLQAPQTAVAANHLAVEQGMVNIKDFEQLRRQLWQHMALNPSLEAIFFANESGEEIGYGRIQSQELVKQAERLAGEDLSIGIPFFNTQKSTAPGKRNYYLVDAKGNPRKLIYTFPIDNRTTPWYRYGKAASQQTWSPVSVYKLVPSLGIFALTPIYDAAGKWQGVFVSNFTLSGISTFLNQLKFSPSGQTFIIERSGNLIATSTLEIPNVKQAKGEPTRLLAGNSKDARTRDIARQLSHKFGNFRTLQTTQQLSLISNHQRQFVRVIPYRDEYGLDWLIVVVVPEWDFMEQIHANTRMTILLCSVALVGSVGVGIVIAGWITKPILRLNTAAKNIAQGQWDKPVEIERADEVGQLAQSFNQMAAQLANYNQTLETQVTQRTAELAHANEQLKGEIAERKMLEGKLHSSTQQFRIIFESIPDIVLIIDEKQSIQIIPTKTLGFYTCDTNLLNAIVEQFFQKDIEEIGFARVRQVLDAQQTVNFDYSLHINEREVWFTACISPLADNAVVWVARNINDRKLAEESLRQYERIVSATTDAMSLVDRNYIYQVVNQSYLTWHNKEYEEIIGHSVSELLGAEIFERLIKEPFDQCLTGETAHYQNWFDLAVGRRFLSVTYSPYLETDKTLSGVVVSLRDITELKYTEERLWQRNQEMQAIFAAFPDILFRVAADGTILDYKTRDEDNLYTSPKQFLGKKVQDILPPLAGQNLQAAIGQVFQTDSPISLEYSLPMPDGEQYFEARMVRLKENEMITVTRNISDRKRAEEQLRQSEAQLNTIVTTTSDGIMILDREGRVCFANPAATDLFNLSLDEFVDYQWGIPVGEMAEIEVVASSGEIRTVEMKATQTQWLGKSAYVLALRDISDRKRSEAALRESIKREHAIAQVLQRMRQSLDINAIFSATTEELRQVIKCDRIAIYQFNPDWSGNFVAESVASGWKTLLLEQHHQPHLLSGILDSLHCRVRDWGVTLEPIQDTYLQTTQGGAYTQGATYLASADIYNTGLSPCHVELLERFQARAYLIVPIFCGNQLWGLLAAYHNDEPRHWSESEINTVVQIGTQLGVALQQAQLLAETRQQSAALQKAVEAADAANLAKSTFLANMSHELRTPLNGIMGYAQILQGDKSCNPKQQDGVNIIYQCGKHLLTLINDILDLSKIEAGKLELYPEEVHLVGFLVGVSDIFKLKAAEKDLNFTCHFFPQLPTVIPADEKRLRQVLMNLLSNAIKFTDAGSVTFKVGFVGSSESASSTQNSNSLQGKSPDSEPFLDTDAFTTQNYQKIRFQVEDTGIGISSEQLDKIFLPFEQVGHHSRRAEGTGLGLAISQKIVEMMGSQILVESTLGVSSTFWFDLTLPKILTATQPIKVQSTNRIIGYSGSKQKILVVDDRWENCAVISHILEPLGFEVEEAANGQEGLEKVVEFQPDLILVDLVMPVMNGHQMTRQLRQFPQFQNTVIIAISANAFAVDCQNSLESGCNDFLPKPVQAEELLNKIKDYLNLSWIYEEGRQEETHINFTEMVIPARDELLVLYEVANSGDIEGVEQECMRLQDLSAEYMSFVIRVLELAQAFEYEKIAKLIDHYLSQDSQ